MNTNALCESVRIALMASRDGESSVPSAADEQHLLNCPACSRWLQDVQSMSAGLQALSYPKTQVDLWAAVESRIRQPKQEQLFPTLLWPIAAIVLLWRALQLFIDLPLPLLHPIVTLAALVATLWLVTQHALAIETYAPELEKRGI